jgi:hypothetical protein
MLRQHYDMKKQLQEKYWQNSWSLLSIKQSIYKPIPTDNVFSAISKKKQLVTSSSSNNPVNLV